MTSHDIGVAVHCITCHNATHIMLLTCTHITHKEAALVLPVNHLQQHCTASDQTACSELLARLATTRPDARNHMAARRTSTFRCKVMRMSDVLHDRVPSCVAEDRRSPNHPKPKQCYGSKSRTATARRCAKLFCASCQLGYLQSANNTLFFSALNYHMDGSAAHSSRPTYGRLREN